MGAGNSQEGRLKSCRLEIIGTRRNGSRSSLPQATAATGKWEPAGLQICIIAADGLLEFKRKFEK
jgi:hypothetical protein